MIPVNDLRLPSLAILVVVAIGGAWVWTQNGPQSGPPAVSLPHSAGQADTAARKLAASDANEFATGHH